MVNAADTGPACSNMRHTTDKGGQARAHRCPQAKPVAHQRSPGKDLRVHLPVVGLTALISRKSKEIQPPHCPRCGDAAR